MPYLAYGLELSCPFSLPGMAPRASQGLPRLALELTERAALETAFSGSDGSPAWRARLGDGCQMTIQTGTAGDLLFSCEDRHRRGARFLLDASGELLDCAPTSAGPGWRRALICTVLATVSTVRGYEALHAAGVDSPDGVLAFAGPSGAGKSTLALEFMRRGWRLFSDDVLTLGRDACGVRAHPATPHVKLGGEQAHHSQLRELGATGAERTHKRWLAVADSTQEPRPLRMICLLQRGRSLALNAELLPANPLLLAPHMLGFRGDAPRQRHRFDLFADLAGCVPLVRLTGDEEDRVADLADLVEGMLERRRALARSAA